jgi:hypothetical protein
MGQGEFYMDWERVRALERRQDLKTKMGEPFRIARVTGSIVFIELPSGEQSVSRTNLEKAERLVLSGARLKGPSDYRRLVADERPAYAWAILRELGIV